MNEQQWAGGIYRYKVIKKKVDMMQTLSRTELDIIEIFPHKSRTLDYKEKLINPDSTT